MFHQLLTPVDHNLALSFLVGMLPIATVLVLLGILKRPAWQSSLAGLVVGLVIALWVWRFPVGLTIESTLAGVAFALWPIMWIVFAALVLYNVAVNCGQFDAFRRWILEHLPDDRRIILIVIGYCFGALLEGVTGFGAPVAIISSLLIILGFDAMDAIVFALIFNTAPVAFGSIGVPITTLAGVTGLPDTVLGAMVGRQLPFLAFLLPFYAIALYGGWRSVRALWPVLLVAAATGALGQFVTANYISYQLTNIVSSLVSLAVTVIFLKLWAPAHDPAFAVARLTSTIERAIEAGPAIVAEPVIVAGAAIAAGPAMGGGQLVAGERGIGTGQADGKMAPWQGWIPWLFVAVVVTVWTIWKFAAFHQMNLPWRGLNNAVFITLYNRPYAAVFNFQPLATGTAILVSAILTALAGRLGIAGFGSAMSTAARQIRLPTLTVTAIVGLAFLMNYSGIAYTLGLAVASVGALFPLVSAFLGWLAVFLSGSDSSGNALFGNLQVVAARQLHLSSILIAATNSSGGVMAKMISPQNIATGCATTHLTGHEGAIFSRTFLHSIFLTVLLGCLVWLQQYVWPWMIAH
ncbi:MAG TPA: L-lactate permease [Steroidobacteraceae bacterium]|nr:L-lactate permease [Steroidobacteraceae bacterium]